MTLTVVEVIGRSSQGITKPYICRCDDGEVYFVKGRSAGRRGLINEWLCGHIARALGLPVPIFAIATVPDELIEADFSGWLRELGAGSVFASQCVSAQDFTVSQVSAVPLEQRRDVLMFDWWVRNADRALTARGGNVNLLWRPVSAAVAEADPAVGLVVIDHNLAFSPDFSAAHFCASHVFAADLADTFSDYSLHDAYSERFADAMTFFQVGWDNLPLEWVYVDPEQTVPTNYPLNEVKGHLRRAQQPDFWRTDQ